MIRLGVWMGMGLAVAPAMAVALSTAGVRETRPAFEVRTGQARTTLDLSDTTDAANAFRETLSRAWPRALAAGPRAGAPYVVTVTRLRSRVSTLETAIGIGAGDLEYRLRVQVSDPRSAAGVGSRDYVGRFHVSPIGVGRPMRSRLEQAEANFDACAAADFTGALAEWLGVEPAPSASRGRSLNAPTCRGLHVED